MPPKVGALQILLTGEMTSAGSGLLGIYRTDPVQINETKLAQDFYLTLFYPTSKFGEDCICGV